VSICPTTVGFLEEENFMRRFRLIFAVLLAFALLAAACGDSEDGSADSGDAETEATADDAPDDDAPEDDGEDDQPAAGEVPGLVEDGKLIVVTTGNFPPFTAIDESTGDNIGYTIDIVREVADRLGLELELPTVDFVAELEGLDQGLYDIADSGIWPTPERQESFLFSRPMTSTGIVAQVRAEDSGTAGLADLSGLDVGGIQGSSQEAYLLDNEAELGYASYSGFSGAGEALTALKQGRVAVLSRTRWLRGLLRSTMTNSVLRVRPLRRTRCRWRSGLATRASVTRLTRCSTR
jgi:ABC-type amino acid transport substrate-binding protein